MIIYHFCRILFIRCKSQSPVHPQGLHMEWIQEAGILGVIRQHLPYVLKGCCPAVRSRSGWAIKVLMDCSNCAPCPWPRSYHAGGDLACCHFCHFSAFMPHTGLTKYHHSLFWFYSVQWVLGTWEPFPAETKGPYSNFPTAWMPVVAIYPPQGPLLCARNCERAPWEQKQTSENSWGYAGESELWQRCLYPQPGVPYWTGILMPDSKGDWKFDRKELKGRAASAEGGNLLIWMTKMWQ